jgi:hypothetical protein
MTIDVTPRLDVEALMAELRRYLTAVDAFRAEGREPVWLSEKSVPCPPAKEAEG